MGWIGLLMGIFGLVSWIVVLVAMFQDEVWKGIVGLLCGLYALYYAVFELEHDLKWLLVIGMLCFGGIRFFGLPH
ncbi:MAG TPA: hypothetical protein VKU00_16435 [Chthonomonadaceae bacterium]|nr:hypothetical protein [Chthonomonadaceae bacterium]